ncbi:MAG: hypothetical protein ACJ798_11490 [Phenylobacterium sp.]
MFDRHNIRLWGFSGVALAGAIPLWIAPVLLIGRVPAGGTRIIFATVCCLLAVAWAMVFAALGFRRADEYFRERSKVAWYWGGLLGIGATAPVYVFIAMGGLHWLDPTRPAGPELFRAFVMGYSLPIIAQLLGFTAVYVWWKAARR